MKTLDETIAEMEGMEFIGTLTDALYYLKEYRSDKIQYEADRKNWEDDLSQKLRFFDEARNKLIAKFKELEIGTLNEPLTWNELKTMEGKPVWIEESADNGLWWTYWEIWKGEIAGLPKKDYSTKWKAYRKERE